MTPSRNDASAIPRGIEVLVKKAAVDAEFKRFLLDERSRAAREIGLELSPAEAAMLDNVPADQLEAIIAQTVVSPVTRSSFLGRAAAAMLAALGAAAGCDPRTAVGGIRPADPKKSPPASPSSATQSSDSESPQIQGIRPDRP